MYHAQFEELAARPTHPHILNVLAFPDGVRMVTLRVIVRGALRPIQTAREHHLMTQPAPLRIAVAGTSFASAVQIPVFQSHPSTQVVAVSSGHAERAASVAKEHGVSASYTDFGEMLDREKPDMVSIATPPRFHCPMTLAALERDIHVLCEKPFAMNAEEARTMLDASRRAGVVAMVDFEFRHLPARAYLVELLRQNYVGQIRMVEFSLHFGWRSRPQDVGWNWWCDRSQGGGALGALGSHAVDSVRLWFGSNPRRVLCDLATFVDRREGRPVTSDDGFTLLMEFASGAQAVLQLSAAAGVDSSRIGVYGSEGQLVIPDFRGASLVGGKRSSRVVKDLKIPERYRLPQESGHILRAPFRSLVNTLVDAIHHQKPTPHPDFTDGLYSQQILDAAHVSSDEQRWVDV